MKGFGASKRSSLPVGEMTHTSQGGLVIRFGGFEFDPATLELRRRGVRLPIQGQPLQVLALLLERRGALVTREVLRAALWPEGTYVDFEHGLNAAVRRLRRALNDQAGTARFIETLARRGYRFVASVDSVGQDALDRDGTGSPWSTIAVLPFYNATGDEENDYLVDGITDRTIDSLSLIPDLRVIARSGVFRYKGSRRPPRAIGRSLGVERIVVGTVCQRDATLLVQAELVDVVQGFQLWGSRFQRPLGDITGLDQDIGQQIYAALRRRVTGAEIRRLRKPGPASALAHREYLNGRYFSNRMTEPGLRRANDHFNGAIAADPRYALAYCGLADCYNLFAFLGLEPPDTVLPKARDAARAALALDDELAEAHASLASITKVYEWDWPAAEAGYRRALALNPSYVSAHRWYAAHLAALGRWDESMAGLQRASMLDPVSPLIATEVAWNWYMAREFDSARAHAIEALDLQPGFPPALFVLGLACEQLGRYEQALDAFRAAAAQAPNPAVVASEAHLLAVMGRRDEAMMRRARLVKLSSEQYVPPYWVAIAAAGFLDRSSGLDWLECALARHDVWLVWLRNDPRLDPFRSEARFRRVLEAAGLTSPERERSDNGTRA
jgi:TolB-like protein/tetratricopeptide (TPR) repeat protein